MTRLKTVLREILAAADRYTAAQFNAPLTHDLLGTTR